MTLIMVSQDNAVYMLLYVDDMLIASGCKAEARLVKDTLSQQFEMKDLGPVSSRILVKSKP